MNQSTEEMKIFICTEFEDCNPGRASQEALRIVLPVRRQGTVMYF